MKRLGRFLIWFVGIILVLVLALYITGYDYLVKAVRTVYFHGHVTAFLDDYQYFDNSEIKNGTPQPWPISKNYNKVKSTDALEDVHRQIETVAFLVFKNDSLWHESYYEGYDKDSKSNSFSMAKSYVSAALGKAIMQGKIKSFDQKVSDFFPEFRYSRGMTVGDLSSMASGLNWDEDYYSPFSITTRAYFDPDLTKCILGLKSVEQPGKSYKYLSGNTQLLAMVIEKATSQKLTDYISENFWKPLGAEHAALWQTDHKNGLVKAYCCIASNARDFARLGKLYEHYGKWGNQQILDSAFIAKSTTPRFADSPQYGYGWWLAEYKGKKVFYMRGHLGQYTIVVPEDQLIIVRLGKGRLVNNDGPHSKDFWVYLKETYKMLEAKR
ncbi:MAG: class C beta-lactamase-related serine hydrolase [Flavobacterium sp.]|nr:MAG: class C beta-lactamase-related serine hydrolase [Flavobacterium sp.]